MKNFSRTRDGQVGGGVNVAAATANVTLTTRSARHQILTPTAARDVTLPALANSKGLPFVIVTAEASAFNLTVKNPAGTTLAVLRPGQSGLFACNATVWAAVLLGRSTAAAQLDRVVIVIPINASSVDGWAFVADRAYTIEMIEEIHAVAGSDGGAVTLDVRKVTDTSAPGAAASATVTELQAAAMNLKSTANTTVTPGLSVTAADLDLADGNKIGLNFIGTLTALAGGVVTIVLKPK